MAQFDIHPTRFPDAPYVVDIQSNLLSHLLTRVVIPLQVPAFDRPMQRLQPTIEIAGKPYILNTPELSSLLVTDLQPALSSSMSVSRQKVMHAVDFLLTGF